MKIPLGQLEDFQQEFKGRDVLNQLPTIARSVVSMLNAQGGIVWIGLAEHEGRADRVEAVDRASEQNARVFNHLLDTIEPRLADEVQVHVIQHQAGALLAIRVNPIGFKRPYVQISHGGRYFHMRVGSRTRDMTRDELRQAFCEQTKVVDQHTLQVRELIAALLESLLPLPMANVPSLTFRLRQAPPLRLDFMRQGIKTTIERLIREPQVSGNRPMGWNIQSPHYELQWNRDALMASTPNTRLKLSATGDLDFTLALDVLRWREAGTVMYPYALLEFPSSLFRMMAELMRAEASEGTAVANVVAQLVLQNVHGWDLRSGSPRSPYYLLREPKRFNVDRVEPTPTVFRRSELVEFPDQCAFHMVREIYGALGYGDKDLPPEFDPVSRRLHIQD